MKKTVAICLSVIICLSLLACQSATNGSKGNIRITAKLLELDDSDITYIQIHYGKQILGIWNDKPAESYQIIPIFGKEADSSVDAAFFDHMVLIDSSLVISISTRLLADSTAAEPECEISDTLGTEVLHLFEEYYTTAYTEGKKYGQYAESNGFWGASTKQSNTFDRFYYVIFD